jgi:hypothetical protein
MQEPTAERWLLLACLGLSCTMDACCTCVTCPPPSRAQIVCQNNTAFQGGCAYVPFGASLVFDQENADGPSDVRGNTQDAIAVGTRGAVRCGNASAAPWTAPNNYTICGPPCACNDAFVAGNSTDCACRLTPPPPPPPGACA